MTVWPQQHSDPDAHHLPKPQPLGHSDLQPNRKPHHEPHALPHPIQ